jgi:hypothetical protein
LFARLSQALLEILNDNPAQAEVILKQLALQRAELGGSDGEVTYKLASLFAMAGRADEGLQQLDLSVRQGFFCVPCLERDPAWENLRQTPAFQRTLTGARARHAAFGKRFQLQ